jgi:hypothetical protein
MHGRGGQQPKRAAGRESRLGDLDVNGRVDADRQPIGYTSPHPNSNRCPGGHPDPAAADRGATGGGSTSPSRGARDAGRLLPTE